MTEVVIKLGYMLETPGIRRYSPPRAAVTMRPVRTISRKDSPVMIGENPQRLYAELGAPKRRFGMR
jgi:hypothetical protein